jgi:hypothetical protein
MIEEETFAEGQMFDGSSRGPEGDQRVGHVPYAQPDVSLYGPPSSPKRRWCWFVTCWTLPPASLVPATRAASPKKAAAMVRTLGVGDLRRRS